MTTVILFGNFFGKNDSWNRKQNNMSFFSKEEVLSLFKNFEIISFFEKDENGKTVLGKEKHWNIFYIVARKM